MNSTKKNKCLIVIGIAVLLIIFYFGFSYSGSYRITMKLDGFLSQKQWEYIKKRAWIKGINKWKYAFLYFNEDNSFKNCSVILLNQHSTRTRHDLKDIDMYLEKNYVRVERRILERYSTYMINDSTYIDDEGMIEVMNRVYKNHTKIINTFKQKDNSIRDYCFIASGRDQKRCKNNEWYLSKDNDFRKITKEDYKIKHNGVKVFLQFEDSDFTCINIFVEE